MNTSKYRRAIQSLWPVRWWFAIRALSRGARVHPDARLLGSRSRLALSHRSKIGRQCILDAGRSGAISLGARVWLSHGVEMETEGVLFIDEDTSIQRRCSINGNVRIGAECILAPNVFISSGTHPFRHQPHLSIREQERRGAGPDMDRPVWIQDDCWLGVNVVVCPGVTIGKGSVVGANSVVTHDVPPYAVFAGIPARRIGDRLDWEPSGEILAKNSDSHRYVLSGRYRSETRDSDCHFEATNARPFHAALKLGHAARSAVVTLATSETLNLSICDSVHRLERGKHQIIVPILPSDEIDRVQLICIQPSADSQHGLVAVFSVKIQ